VRKIFEHTTSSVSGAEQPLLPWNGAAIILMDLDAFFASVEQLDHPDWKGKPVIVGGSPERRGVVSTASYEARKFGVHSAMPSSMAARLCPQAIWTSGNFHRYREMSAKVMTILQDESPHLMQVSIDEAFLDVTPTRANKTHPVTIAQRIQKRVGELGITCSIGLGESKAVAKIASNQSKPQGLTVVYPGHAAEFLAPLPVKEMSGIGPVAQKRLHSFHLRTLGDVASADTAILRQVFGKNAQLIADRCRGIDTPVIDEAEPVKSISNEISFAQSLASREEIQARIATMAHKVGRRLRRKGMEGTTLHLKVRKEDLSVRACQKKLPNLGTNDLTWLPLLYQMLGEIWEEGEKLRLVGVGVSGFEEEPVQESLFEDFFYGNENAEESPLIANAAKNEKLLLANDAIAQRFGEGAVRFGHEIRSYQDTTGSSAKNPEDYKD
jgi:DNA polymerase IV